MLDANNSKGKELNSESGIGMALSMCLNWEDYIQGTVNAFPIGKIILKAVSKCFRLERLYWKQCQSVSNWEDYVKGTVNVFSTGKIIL
jgi:hypothetical protein